MTIANMDWNKRSYEAPKAETAPPQGKVFDPEHWTKLERNPSRTHSFAETVRLPLAMRIRKV